VRYKVLTTMTLFGLSIVPLASAQSSQAVEADIPFDFGVQNTVLPAGTYRLTYNLGTRRVSIRDLDQRGTAMVLQSAVGVDPKGLQQNKKAHLVFNRYGNTYFLSQMWQGNDTTNGLELGKSRGERHIIARVSTPAGVERTSIIVAAR
jgi:hypothetical protein